MHQLKYNKAQFNTFRQIIYDNVFYVLSTFCWLIHFVLPVAQALCDQTSYVTLIRTATTDNSWGYKGK